MDKLQFQMRNGTRITGLLRKGVHSLRANGVAFTWQLVKRKFREKIFSKGIARQALFSAKELAAQRCHCFPRTIRFSIVVPLYNTPRRFLGAMIESVIDQTYADWELCMADGSDGDHAEVEQVCREYMRRDSRIRYQRLKRNLGISANTNACLAMAKGDYVGLLDHDDLLHPAALHEVMKAICEKNAEFVYTDENTFHDKPKDAFRPHFKPAYAPDTLRANNYICHFAVFKRSLLDEVGLFDPACDGAQDHDLILRLTEKAARVVHIPEILYYWRAHKGSVAQEPGVKPYAIAAGILAVEKSLQRAGQKGEVSTAIDGSTVYRIQYELEGTPKVSILIPNCEHLSDLRSCLESIYQKTSYPNFEIVVIENNSKSKQIFDYYKAIQEKHENLRVIKWDGKFNYSAVNNYGARFCSGQYLLLLNNDTKVITPNWIEEMLMFAQRSDVGAVGAKLYYPGDTIQHAGIIFGLGGVAGHAFEGVGKEQIGYMARTHYAQNLSCVTGACMLLRRAVWEEVHGLDEQLAVAFNDVDLCMRIRKAGYRIVWTPFAELYHYESRSRGLDDSPEKQRRFQSEVEFMKERWNTELEMGDPYYNPNFRLDNNMFIPGRTVRQYPARQSDVSGRFGHCDPSA